jgi:hypothetical protein
MLAEELPDRFLDRVRAAGADPLAPPPLVAWRSFVEVAHVPVEGIAPPFDLLVFESLPWPEEASRPFGAEFVRRISVYANDDYAGSKVFSCALVYDLEDVPPPFERALVQKTRDQLPTFVTEVERSGAFKTLMGLTPTRVTVHLGAG